MNILIWYYSAEIIFAIKSRTVPSGDFVQLISNICNYRISNLDWS